MFPKILMTTLPSFQLRFRRSYNHIDFYLTPSGITSFIEQLAPYKRAKGSVNFPLDKPIPYDLIDKIVRFRVMENLQEVE